MKAIVLACLLTATAFAQNQTIITTAAQNGMKCDGVTDDTQRFINSLGIGGPTSNVIYTIFVTGTCNIKWSNPITVPSNVTLDFTQAGALFLASGSTMNVNAAIVDNDYHPIFTGPGTYNIIPRNPVTCSAITGGTACAAAAATSSQFATINTIPGSLMTNNSSTQLEFWAKPAADPNGTWMWFGADIASANIGLFNYDMVLDDTGNPVGQRNMKFQPSDDVILQSKTGASGSPLSCGRNEPNGGCLVSGNLSITTPNSGNPAGTPGFTDSILMTIVTHSPTSAGTAGRAGELVWDGTNLYLCTGSGSAGSATWKKLVLQAD